MFWWCRIAPCFESCVSFPVCALPYWHLWRCHLCQSKISENSRKCVLHWACVLQRVRLILEDYCTVRKQCLTVFENVLTFVNNWLFTNCSCKSVGLVTTSWNQIKYLKAIKGSRQVWAHRTGLCRSLKVRAKVHFSNIRNESFLEIRCRGLLPTLETLECWMIFAWLNPGIGLSTDPFLVSFPGKSNSKVSIKGQHSSV
jgi:hypothetical protein